MILLITGFLFCRFLNLNLVIFDFELVFLNIKALNFILLFDLYSTLFLSSVLLISARVFTFRASYITNDKFYVRFHVLLLVFVISIIILILRPNLVRIILGWDGLGIRSYILVIYYSRRKSYNAGIITALSNRIGDALILISLGLLIWRRSLSLIFISEIISNTYGVIFLIIAASTKRAQIPFRAWLPAAMAAPTPVSALVHSSTLVTAGGYLVFRFENIISKLDISRLILILGAVTIFMARIRAFFEIDIKKIVALSTLRQLGVIIVSLGAGFYNLAYFHLLSHAYFKALLFISAGNLIHASESYQDLRVIGGALEIIPLTGRVVLGCSIRLGGLPFISAFYSKEGIIEKILIDNTTFIGYFLIVLGILMTIFYSTRFILLALNRARRQHSIFLKSDIDTCLNFRIILLFFPAIRGGRGLSLVLGWFPSLILISIYIKIIILIFIFLGGVRIIFINYIFKKIDSVKFIWILGSLWGLPFVRSRFPIRLTKSYGDWLQKISDFSWVIFITSTFLPARFKFQSFKGVGFNSLNLIQIFISSALIFFIFYLLIW